MQNGEIFDRTQLDFYYCGNKLKKQNGEPLAKNARDLYYLRRSRWTNLATPRLR